MGYKLWISRIFQMIFLSIIPFLISCTTEEPIKENNDAPTITITSHLDGFEVLDSFSEQLVAEISDPDNNPEETGVTWYLDEEIACNFYPTSEEGESFCEIQFQEGDGIISAEVRDIYEGAGRTEITVNVLPSEAPVVDILTPVPENSFYVNQPLIFSALVSDVEDNNEDLIIQWSSSLDGELELDTTIDSFGEISDFTALSFGQHAIELRVEDSTGKVTTDEVVIEVIEENSPPDCEILEPSNSSAFPTGETIQFRATATDIDIPNDLLNVEWISDKEGTFGSSIPTTNGDIGFNYSALSNDSHTITMLVTDEMGTTCSDQVLISMTTGPAATIEFPADGDIVETGSIVSFEGRVFDIDDSINSLEIEWSSSIDGRLYLGAPASDGTTNFSTAELSSGLHVIALYAQDPTALTGADVINLTVNSPPVVDSLSLSPTSPSPTDTLTCTANAFDPDGAPVNLSFTFLNQTTSAVYAPTSSNGGTATLDLSTTNSQAGDSIMCSVMVVDSLGLSVSSSVTVTVM